jgi:Bacterial type II and III secretion system protein
MRLITSFAIIAFSFQLAVAVPPESSAPPRGPLPPGDDFTAPPQDTRLIIVDFKIVESQNGKEQAIASPRVAVPIGQTGEVSIGDIIPGAADEQAKDGQAAKDQKFVGTKVYVTPVLRRDGKIQMTFKLRISQLAQGQGANAANPKIDVREANNNAVASQGQAVIVSGFKTGEIETRITAAARIIDAGAAMKGQGATSR